LAEGSNGALLVAYATGNSTSLATGIQKLSMAFDAGR